MVSLELLKSMFLKMTHKHVILSITSKPKVIRQQLTIKNVSDIGHIFTQNGNECSIQPNALKCTFSKHLHVNMILVTISFLRGKDVSTFNAALTTKPDDTWKLSMVL